MCYDVDTERSRSFLLDERGGRKTEKRLREIRAAQRRLQRAIFVARRRVVSCETNKFREKDEKDGKS